MALFPSTQLTTANVAAQLQSDALYWRSVIAWAQQRYNAYNQELTTTVMNNLAIAAADQNIITAFIGDLNRFNQLAGGTLPANATNMTFDLIQITGLQ